MNIFYTDKSPIFAARNQVDRHLPKMIVESAQLLSTAHRVLDGKEQTVVGKSGRKKKVWVHPEREMDHVLYAATHVNHPSNKWIREARQNYDWLYLHFAELALIFERKHNGTRHKSWVRLGLPLASPPDNLKKVEETPILPAISIEGLTEEFTDPVEAYRVFYATKKARMPMEWKSFNKEEPDWWAGSVRLAEEKGYL